MANENRSVPRRQKPLQKRYRSEPEAAWIEDGAHARIGGVEDAFHVEVVPHNAEGRRWDIGIHRAVGGDHDLPNPGDVLSAALAACLHTTTRMLAEHMKIPLLDLDIDVGAEVDVRGCLLVDSAVPVGFQRMRCSVRLRVPADVTDDRVQMLMQMAEHCCVVSRTLQSGTDVQTSLHVERDATHDNEKPSTRRGGHYDDLEA